MQLEKTFASNSAVIAELVDLLSGLPDNIYHQQSPPRSQKKVSSIGAHCRHIIEFYQSFLKGAFSGTINYDERARDTELETNRLLALKEIRNIEQQLSELMDNHLLPATLYLQAQIDTKNAITIKTSPERELAFLQSHSVHHQAMIALMMHCFELPLPSEFGVATSTRKHNQELEAQATD